MSKYTVDVETPVKLRVTCKACHHQSPSFSSRRLIDAMAEWFEVYIYFNNNGEFQDSDVHFVCPQCKASEEMVSTRYTVLRGTRSLTNLTRAKLVASQ